MALTASIHYALPVLMGKADLTENYARSIFKLAQMQGVVPVDTKDGPVLVSFSNGKYTIQ